ncbi:hypothetical protein AX15_005074 [Amanita polypyramis BW_CC]|nr:hypothetical protein AX15_005074 [Amanita polypyramis BW_CC]
MPILKAAAVMPPPPVSSLSQSQSELKLKSQSQSQISSSAINQQPEHENTTNTNATDLGTTPAKTKTTASAISAEVKNEEDESLTSCNVPVVRLGVLTVSDVLAAGLASALVGHVLFLKSQVPLPVMRLARMAGSGVCFFFFNKIIIKTFHS